MSQATLPTTGRSVISLSARVFRQHFGRIERYVLRELATPLVLTFVLASVLLLSGEFLTEIIDKWLNRGLSPSVAAQVLTFMLPPLFIFTLPVALLLSVLITFGRLSEDHEIVAMQAAGLSWMRLFAPVFALGVLAAGFNCWLANTIIPEMRRQSRDFLVQTMLANPTLLLEPQSWLQEVRDMQVWVGDIDDDRGELHDLRIYKDDGHGGTQAIVAALGRIDVDESTAKITLELHDGAIHQMDPNDSGAYDVLKFKSIRIPFPVYAIARWAARVSQIKESEKTFRHLFRDYRANVTTGKDFWTEVGERTAMPFACITFVLVGAPLGIRPHKSLRAYGAGVCIGLVLVFYLLYTVGKVLDRTGAVHPLIGTWLPNLFLGTVGVVAMVRLGRR